MKKLLSFLSFALIGHFSYSQNYTPQESNKRSIYLMPVRVDSVASSAYKRVITRYLSGAFATIVSASTYTTNGEERVAVSRTSNTTITLGTKDVVQGKTIIVQDIAGTRGVSNYIQIASSSGNINGAAYIRIETGGALETLTFDGTNWNTQTDNTSLDGEAWLVHDGTTRAYTTILTANAAATSGDVIVLQKDVVISSTVTLPSGVSINGNGKTITMPITGTGIEITAGNCSIFNVKQLIGTAGTDAQNSSHTIYIHGSTAVATIQIDEIALGKSPILNAGDDAQVFLNVKKIDLGTDNQYNIYSWRKIFVSAGAFVKLTGATVTGGTGTGSFGSVVHSGGASFADRSILEVENCWINIGCGAFIAERGGELRCTNLNVTTALDRSIFGSHYGEAGQPYGVMIFKDSKFFSGSTQASSPTANSCFWTLGGIWYCEFHGVNEFNDGGATSYTMVDGSGAGTYDWKNYGKLYVNKAANISLFDAGYNAEIIWPEVPSGGGAVTTVTASSPLASSGGTTPNISVSGTIGVANGGTGATSFTANRILYGNGTSAIGSSANLTFDGSKFSVAGAADAFLVTSTGSGVTSQLEQTSNNDVLHRFKRNGGNYWDARYYYTGEAFKFNYNDTPVLTLNSSGAATLAGALTAASASLTTPLAVGSGGTGTSTLTGILKGNGTSAYTAATAGTDYIAGGVGTSSYIAKFSASGVLANSTIQDDGSTITYNNTNVLHYASNPIHTISAPFGSPALYFRGASAALLGGIYADYVNGPIRIGGFGSGYFPAFYSNSVEVARFFSNGRFAVNTTTDAGYLADFNGTGRFTGALTIGSTTASTSTTTGSATFAGGIGVAGAGYFGGGVEGSGIFRALSGSYSAAATGKGVEISYDSGGDYGQLLSYDRTGSAFKPFYFNASQTRFQINSATKGLFNADGLIVGGTATNSGDVLTISNSGASQVEIGQFTSTLVRTFFFNRGTGLYITNQVNALDHRFHIGGTEKVRITSTGDLSVYNTTASTSTGTGSGIFAGGLGVAGRASLASAVVNTTLSVNGLTAGATTDTTVVVNAGVFKKILRSTQVDYAAWSGTDTWDGSAPSGTETHTYGYKVEGKTVTGWIRLEYSGGGLTNTYVDIELSAFPAPSIPAYVGSGETAFAANGFLATSNTANPVASRAWLYEASGALKLKILAASNGYQFAMATFTYQIP